MTELRVGIAGYGVIGRRRHHHLDRHPRARVVAACDITLAGVREVEPGVRAYETPEKLLADEDLDVVFVCLPNDIASEVTIQALRKGCHVFCEKPPGRSVEDIVRVRQVEAANPSLRLKYGFNHRYHDSVKEALRIVRSGELGRVVNMSGLYGKSAVVPWPRPQAFGSKEDEIKTWRTSRRIAGGGILLDQGIHMVDLMLAFAGPFDEVKSFVSNGYWNHDVEDNAHALLRSSNSGVVAMLHSTATQWRHRFNLEIFLEEGALLLTGILSGSKSYGDEKLTIMYREDDANGNPRETTTSFIRDHSWRDEIADFFDCIETGQPVSIGTSAEALASMELVYRIYAADSSWAARYGIAAPEAAE